MDECFVVQGEDGVVGGNEGGELGSFEHAAGVAGAEVGLLAGAKGKGGGCCCRCAGRGRDGRGGVGVRNGHVGQCSKPAEVHCWLCLR